MIFDPDHLSVKARQSSMDVIEALHYPGIISSHSWSTPDTYPRIYKDGGFITPYAGDSTGFVAKWRRHVGWADKRYYWGFGFGADINGLGAQGDARGANVSNKVTYPFKGFNGVTVNSSTPVSASTTSTRTASPSTALPRLGRGPHQGRRQQRRQGDLQRHDAAAPRLTCRCGSGRSASRPTPAATRACARRLGRPSPDPPRHEHGCRHAQGRPAVPPARHEYGVCAKAPGKPKVMVTIHFSPAGRVTGLEA